MAQQLILTGAAANDKTGDTLRASFTKVNANFTELYAMTGTQGLQGTQGTQGRQGITGAQGTEGLGTQGTQGEAIQGTEGAQGTQGTEGMQGAQGTEGSQGTEGMQGAQGIEGAQGAQGTEGSQGIQGITGIQGTIGQAGHSASYYSYKALTFPYIGDPGAGNIIWNNVDQLISTQINVSHLTTDDIDVDVFLSLLKSGDTIIIQDANDSDNYITYTVNGAETVHPNSYVEIPVTCSGSGGIVGFANTHEIIMVITSAGIQGVQGTQGTEGAQGIAGSQGITGIQGTQGSTGAGTQGTQGRQGIQGSVGTGVQGAQGTQGTQGRQGIQGSNGNQGTQGTQGIQGAQGIVSSNLSISTLTVSGTASLNGLTQIQQVDYPFTTKTNASGTVTHDCSVGQVFYHTSPSSNFTVNLTNLGVSSGYVTKVELYIVQGSSGRLPNAVQIAGSSKTISWFNAVTPSPSSNAVDLVTFRVLLSGTTYTVFGKLEKFDTVSGGGGG